MGKVTKTRVHLASQSFLLHAEERRGHTPNGYDMKLESGVHCRLGLVESGLVWCVWLQSAGRQAGVAWFTSHLMHQHRYDMMCAYSMIFETSLYMEHVCITFRSFEAADDWLSVDPC